MKINLVIFFVFNIVFCLDCLEQWINENLDAKDKVIYLDLNVNDEQINIYYYQDNIKINTSNHTLLSNSKKTSKYIFKTNQLFIDFPDKNFNNYISNFFDLKKNIRKFKSMDNNIYYLKKNNKLDKMKLYFDNECMNLDSVIVKDESFQLKINNIKINYLLNKNLDSLFVLNFLNSDVIKYDFRYEK
jgi:hypothetical protein